MAGRGAPPLIVSDNAKPFVATEGWLETLQLDEYLNGSSTSQETPGEEDFLNVWFASSSLVLQRSLVAHCSLTQN